MPGTSLLEFSLFKSSKLHIFQALGDAFQNNIPLLLFSTLQVHFPSPFLKRLQPLQALNHVTIIPVTGNWRALPWVPINTCYLISQRGCWWLMHTVPSMPSPSLPRGCPTTAAISAWGVRVTETGQHRELEKCIQLFKSWNLLVVIPVINLQTKTMQLWNVLAANV